MENYAKGKNVEEPFERDKIPIPDLPHNFLWMQVSGSSKIRNLLTHALNEFPECRAVVWSGSGPGVGKAVTCVEIMKREHKNALYQINKICYRNVEEYWEPLIEGLDQLVVKRKVPTIHILLSMDPLNENELGYQAPGSKVSCTPERKFLPKQATPTKEFAAMGMHGRGGGKRRKPTRGGPGGTSDKPA